MTKLISRQNELDYAGFFTSPAFALWKGGIDVIEGVYKTFTSYNVSLADISLDNLSSDSASQGLKVDLNELGDYRFGFEQVEWTASDIDDSNLIRIPEVLKGGEDWLRTIVPDLSFNLHVLSRYSHNTLSEGTSREFLRKFSYLDIPGVGSNLGSGVIFHWELPEPGWRMNITLDHSNLVTDGLFIEQEITAAVDDIDYTKVLITSQKILTSALAKIDLEFDGE